MMQTHIADHEDELPFYDHEKRELHGRQLSKARRLVNLGKVHKAGTGSWNIDPIEGYNKRHYEVEHDGVAYKCNCQFSAINLRICSHILAVVLYEQST